MKTQAEVVYEFMDVNGSITSMDAFQYLNITRLAARISDLKKQGVEIETVTENHNGKYFARYSLKKSDHEKPPF